MWAPEVAALLTVHLTRLGGASLALRWGGARYALLAYATPPAYALIAYSLVWILGLGVFADPAGIAADV